MQANPIIELKTYRPHEGKAYPIHLKASESAVSIKPGVFKEHLY